MTAAIYKDSMAYIGETPWHGIGHEMPAGASIEDWIEAAGFDFTIKRSWVRYLDAMGRVHKMDNRVVLFRDDDPETALSVVSDQYRVVQPATVMEFFRDLCADERWTLETAGVLGNGGKYWALAKTEAEDSIDGTSKERHVLYQLLATSCDLSLATTAIPTAVRVVCNNTLQMALSGSNGKGVKVPHSTTFNPQQVQHQLGLVDWDASWNGFLSSMRALQEAEVSPELASEFFSELLRPTGVKPAERLNLQAESFEDLLDVPFGGSARKATTDKAPPERAIRGLSDLMLSYNNAPGAAPGTAYGLVQGVTHWLDHARGRDAGKRLQSSWFGQGATLKQRALSMARDLAA